MDDSPTSPSDFERTFSRSSKAGPIPSTDNYDVSTWWYPDGGGYPTALRSASHTGTRRDISPVTRAGGLQTILRSVSRPVRETSRPGDPSGLPFFGPAGPTGKVTATREDLSTAQSCYTPPFYSWPQAAGAVGTEPGAARRHHQMWSQPALAKPRPRLSTAQRQPSWAIVEKARAPSCAK